METLLVNLSGQSRRERMLDKEYLVVPMSLIVPGILNGSRGPLLYPESEVAKDPTIWNNIPIVLEHPTQNGSPTSAKTPEVLNRSSLGFLMRSKFANGKLSAEGWFDVEQTRRIDNGVMASLENGNPLELSTGLQTDNEPNTTGETYNGQRYDFIARNYRPDHLAILPNTTGACSIADGCGVLVNEKEGFAMSKVENSGRRLIGFAGSASRHIHGVGVDADAGNGFTSWEDGHVHEIKNFKILSSPQTSDNHTHRLDRTTLVDSGINLNEGDLKMAEITAEKKAIVDKLITNCKCWEEADRETLNGFSDEKLGLLTPAKEKKEPVEKGAYKGFTDTLGNVHIWNEKEEKYVTQKKKELVENQKPDEPMTEADWMKSAPESVVNKLNYTDKLIQEKKDEIIGHIVVNVKDDDAKEAAVKVLNTKSIEELNTLAVLAPEPKQESPTHNYRGAVGSSQNVSPKEPDYDTVPLEAPVLNFADRL